MMDSTGIWPHSHGCCHNLQKCSKPKKAQNPSLLQKKLCGFVFRRNNDNRVYRSESFRFIHKTDAFLPQGRSSTRNFEIPVSENYVDPVDHQVNRQDEPPYNEIAEKYNAPYYYSDTIKDVEPPYCSPFPARKTFRSNRYCRKSGWNRDQTLHKCKNESDQCPSSNSEDTNEYSPPPQSSLDGAVTSLFQPIQSISLEDNNEIISSEPARRSYFVSICHIENSPNGTLSNFSVLTTGQSESIKEPPRRAPAPYRYVKASESRDRRHQVPLSGHYRSFRALQCSPSAKSEGCVRCCQIQNIAVPMLSKVSGSGSSTVKMGINCSSGSTDAKSNDTPAPDPTINNCDYCSISKLDSVSLLKDSNPIDLVTLCEGHVDFHSCCYYHPVGTSSTSENGLESEQTLWPCDSCVPGHATNHFYSQVSCNNLRFLAGKVLSSPYIHDGKSTNRKSSSSASSRDSFRKPHHHCHQQHPYPSNGSTPTSGAVITTDDHVDFVNSDNNYVQPPPYLNASDLKCQIRQHHCKIDMPLENQDWFHGAITRLESEKLLEIAFDGSFLVRNCEQSPQNHYSLSIRSSKGFIHIRIEPNGVGTYTLGEQEFPSVPYLIHHFMLSKLPIKGEEHVKLMHPVITQLL